MYTRNNIAWQLASLEPEFCYENSCTHSDSVRSLIRLHGRGSKPEAFTCGVG